MVRSRELALEVMRSGQLPHEGGGRGPWAEVGNDRTGGRIVTRSRFESGLPYWCSARRFCSVRSSRFVRYSQIAKVHCPGRESDSVRVGGLRPDDEIQATADAVFCGECGSAGSLRDLEDLTGHGLGYSVCGPVKDRQFSFRLTWAR